MSHPVTRPPQLPGTSGVPAAPSTRPVPGARRMPPANRTQRTEFLPAPTSYQAPLGRASAEWPIIEVYARLRENEDDT